MKKSMISFLVSFIRVYVPYVAALKPGESHLPSSTRQIFLDFFVLSNISCLLLWYTLFMAGNKSRFFMVKNVLLLNILTSAISSEGLIWRAWHQNWCSDSYVPIPILWTLLFKRAPYLSMPGSTFGRNKYGCPRQWFYRVPGDEHHIEIRLVVLVFFIFFFEVWYLELVYHSLLGSTMGSGHQY